MCFYLYLASDRVHKLIEWDEAGPKLCIDEVKADKPKPRVFSKPNLYLIGSDQGCGCGFRQEIDALYTEFAETDDNRKNQYALFSYLTESLRDEEFVELYGVWAGDEDGPVEKTREVRVKEVQSDEFYFSERELTIVRN